MDNNKLALLEPGAIDDLTTGFARAGSFEPKRSYVSQMSRDVDLSLADAVIKEALRAGVGPEADRWLAPRLHAALRLTRGEASDRRLWSYLGVVKYPNYVRERFGQKEEGAPLDRFAGPDAKQALARLWWIAELTRNGADYSDVILACTPQEVPNTGLKLRCFRHRPTAIALARICATGADGKPLAGRKINALFKMINARLSVTTVHAVAADLPPEQGAILRWLGGPAPAVQDVLTSPTGPSDRPVDDDALRSATAFVTDVARTAGVLE